MAYQSLCTFDKMQCMNETVLAVTTLIPNVHNIKNYVLCRDEMAEPSDEKSCAD